MKPMSAAPLILMLVCVVGLVYVLLWR